MTMPEIWAGIAAAFLGLAAVASGLAMFGVWGSRVAIAMGARVAALAALVVALITAALVQGRWTAADPRQAWLSLIAAMLAVHLLLAWRPGAGAGPVVDLVALALGLASVFAIRAGAPSPLCVQQASLLQAHWVLCSLGGGSALVAGCAGLMLALKKGLAWRGRDVQLPGWIALHGLLTQAALLTLVTLGGGLIIGVWWAWRTSGALVGGNAREVWMAVAWLTAAMSVLAWQLDDRRSRWAAGLALVAAAAVLVGLLFPAAFSSVGI